MPLDQQGEYNQELDYLYRRLATVNNLIRSLEEYERHRPKPAPLAQEKSA